MMAYTQWMITNVTLLVITLIAFIGNGLIAAVIVGRQSLRNKTANYLIGALTASTSLISLVCLPYEAILIAGLSPNLPTNYSSAAINWSSAPFVGGTMITTVLTLGIAFDRMHALVRPIPYRSVNHARQTLLFFLVGAILAICITIFHLMDADMTKVKLNCSAGGCYWGDHLRVVWAVVTVLISGLTTIFCAVLIFELRRHRRMVATQADTNVGIINRSSQNVTIPSNSHEERVFMRANMVAFYVLLGSTVFVTIPMIVNGYSVVWGSLVFQALGPFVALGVFSSAAFNVIIYGFKQKEIRIALFAIFRGKPNIPTPGTLPTGVSVRRNSTFVAVRNAKILSPPSDVAIGQPESI